MEVKAPVGIEIQLRIFSCQAVINVSHNEILYRLHRRDSEHVNDIPSCSNRNIELVRSTRRVEQRELSDILSSQLVSAQGPHWEGASDAEKTEKMPESKSELTIIMHKRLTPPEMSCRCQIQRSSINWAQLRDIVVCGEVLSGIGCGREHQFLVWPRLGIRKRWCQLMRM